MDFRIFQRRYFIVFSDFTSFFGHNAHPHFIVFPDFSAKNRKNPELYFFTNLQIPFFPEKNGFSQILPIYKLLLICKMIRL